MLNNSFNFSSEEVFVCAIELLEIHPSSVGPNPTIESVTVMLRWHVALTTNQCSKHAASVCNKMLNLFPGYCCATIQRV